MSWTGFVWLRIGSVPGHCEQGNSALGRTVRGNS